MVADWTCSRPFTDLCECICDLMMLQFGQSHVFCHTLNMSVTQNGNRRADLTHKCSFIWTYCIGPPAIFQVVLDGKTLKVSEWLDFKWFLFCYDFMYPQVVNQRLPEVNWHCSPFTCGFLIDYAVGPFDSCQTASQNSIDTYVKQWYLCFFSSNLEGDLFTYSLLKWK